MSEEELIKKYHNKKVTCTIRGRFIRDALLVMEGNAFYLLQNEVSCCPFSGYKKYGYKYSYYIGNIDSAIKNHHIKFLEENVYELW